VSEAATRELVALHVVASVNPDTGGPAHSVTGLAAALSRLGVRVSVASLDYAEHGPARDAEGVANVRRVPGALGKRLRGRSPALATAISDVAAGGVDIIHSHGLWMYPNLYARRVAVRNAIPLVISPRGMLDAWSLGRSAIRKAVASVVYEKRNLASARLFHATSRLEALAIRQHGLTQPIAVIPNGVDVPDAGAVPPRAVLEERFPELRDRRWLLFMGRLDPKKGVDLLIDAWRELRGDFPAWRLVIAGPDLAGYGAKLRSSLAADPALLDSITYTGMLDGALKRAALFHAEVFVLPTRSENFGVAVAEALAAGTPVVTTTAAPWNDVVTHDCGWWVEPDSRTLRAALASALQRTPDELAAMGRRGRQWVADEFSWNSAGLRMAEAYRWIIGEGPLPDCVHEP
jgi:glycosyltransferase involved in cell wall biosynthesis